MEYGSGLYWFIWFLTTLICLSQIAKAYKSNVDILGLPFLICMMFGYFFVYQSYNVTVNLGRMLEVWMLELGQFIALACLSSILCGWYYGRKLFFNFSYSSQSAFNQAVLWNSGIFFSIVGITGLYSFSFQENLQWEKISNYWYMLFHVSYPGILLCVLVYSRNKEYRTILRTIVLIILIVAVMYLFIMNARRGPLFPMVIVLLYAFMFNLWKVPKRNILVATIVLTGLTMLTFAQVRDYSRKSGTWGPKQIANLSFETVINTKSKSASDNEFLYNCGMIATNYELGMYQYGTGYLSLLTHWVPRVVWEGKPHLGQGWFEWIVPYIRSVTGFTMSTGAAATGVADSFSELGFAAPLLWFLFGLFAAHKYFKAKTSNDLSCQASYISFLAGLHWLVAQGFAASFVPIVIYMTIPWLVFRSARIKIDNTSIHQV